ncbi:hypothetical protein [Shewanella chilikensis]|uniref:hypothetical protein n=1 Tax=Shewanella chilikensis TaxID=558541 RepID=UPI001CFABC14|nr:hypothetical protein [Shewanella chilikensis]
MHRGRIQAQGDGLEESESWNENTPLTHAEGLEKKADLKNKLPRRELNVRADAFNKARTFIDRARDAGGVTAEVSKTYMVKGESQKRVDIEVRAGKAFI